MIELCYSKWFKVKKIIYFISFGSKLPKEIEKAIQIVYVKNAKEAWMKLKN